MVSDFSDGFELREEKGGNFFSWDFEFLVKIRDIFQECCSGSFKDLGRRLTLVFVIESGLEFQLSACKGVSHLMGKTAGDPVFEGTFFRLEQLGLGFFEFLSAFFNPCFKVCGMASYGLFCLLQFFSVLSVSLHKRKKVNFFRQGRGGDAMPL